MSKPKSGKLPQRVVDRIEATTGQVIGSRAARVVRCDRCSAAVFRGLDADICALDAVTDLAPLTAAGEAAALITGRTTYRITWATHRASPRYELDRRDRWQIAGSPADPAGRVEVLAEHRCGVPLGTGYVAKRVSRAPVTDSDTPPF